MQIYATTDYREAIKILMDQRQKFDKKATFQDLANEIRVPKSYVSKVLLGKANFSTDQMYLITKYFDVTPAAAHYLGLLIEYDRTGIAERKKHLLSMIRESQQSELQTSRNIGAAMVHDDQKKLEEYYLDPFNCIIHMALLLDKFQKNPQKIAKELEISPTIVSRSIQSLVKLGLVEYEKDVPIVKAQTIHLPKDSLVFKSWSAQIRLLSQHRLLHADRTNGYSISVAFTARDGGRSKIQAKFLEFLKDVEACSNEQNADEVLQLNFDLFSWL